MSQNQTRGRSSNPRGFPAVGSGRGRDQSPVSSNPSASRSFKKSSNGQSRPTATGTNQVPVSSQGSSEVRAPNACSRSIPKAPSSHPSQSAIPPKGNASRASVPLQFGSISPGIMNNMQIPARTNSAPPKLDEQKHAQGHHDSFRAKSTMPLPSAPKEQQQQTRINVSDSTQSGTQDSRPQFQTKRDVHVPISSASTAIPPKSSVLPIGGMPMCIPFQQPQVPIQFGGPSPQMQPQGLTFNSLQMSMALPVLNGPQAPQQFFIPSFQSHPMQPPTMMHQGQGLGFAHPIGHQLPPQLGNFGFGIAPQFSQPQPVNFVGSRKTAVKITHPETHEELKLDRHKESKASNQINYYPTQQTNSYNPSPIFNPTSTSTSQLIMSSKGPRYKTPASQNEQTISFAKQPVHNPILANNTELSLPASAPAPVKVTIRPAVNSFVEKSGSIHQRKLEAPMLLIPEVDACVAQHKEGGEVDQQSKSVEIPSDTFSVADEHSTAAPSSRIFSSSHVTPVGDSINQSSDSIKEQEEETRKRAYHQQQNKPDVSDTAGMTKTISKSVKESSDIIAQEKLGSFSLSNSSTFTTSLLSSAVEQESSEEFKTEAVPAVSVSYGVPLEREISEDSSLSSVSLELAANKNSSEERDSHEASTSLGSKAGRTVSEISVSTSSLHDNRSAETENIHEKMALNDKSEVSPDLLQDCSSAGSYPVSATADSLETVNKTVMGGKQDILVVKSEEKATHVLCHGEEQPQTGKEIVHCKPKVEIGEKVADVPYLFSKSKDGGYPISSSDAAEYKRLGHNKIMNKLETTSSKDSLPGLVSLEQKQKLDGEVIETSSRELGLKDKPNSDLARSKMNGGNKKKLKDILSRADAIGSSDLYNAYKGPDEKKSTVDTSESIDGSLIVNGKNVLADDHQEDVIDVEVGQIKPEIDDWEDAADISTPDLIVENMRQAHGNENNSKKRYVRDFLLTFCEQCADLPVGFEIGSDIENALMISPVGTYPSPGRIPDRSPYSGNNEKWTKAAGGFGTGEIWLNMGYAAANISSLPGQGVNNVVVRNSHTHLSNHFASGILPGPMQPLSNADADRWQRAIGVQRGVVPFHAPSQIIHKATDKYEVGKVSDIEQAKQRQVKSILNKLTPQNFEKLFCQVKEVNIDNTATLTGVISQIFDKALMEPTFCEMYANFCACLSNELPDFMEDNVKITFRRLLLNKCQEEFERGEREEAEASRVEKVGESKQTAAEREEKRIKARRRMLGNIRLIGELYKKRMLTERIMHECIKKLLGDYQNPDEEDLESLCKLMGTIGDVIDHARAKEHMDAYFDWISKLSIHEKLTPRIRFLLRDTIDLRKNNWKQRRKVEGPKKIDEVHRDAAHERQAQAGRLARGPIITSGPRQGPSVDYNHRGSALLSSSNSQHIGIARGLPIQFHGYTNQDARVDDRNHFESRVLSVPLKRTSDNSITLGPQGGLARGMSIRGQPIMSADPSTNNPLTVQDPNRVASGPSGYSSISREETMQRDWIGVNDRSTPTNPSGRIHGSLIGIVDTPSQSNFLSEDALREKSISTIREFYSAKDEEEVHLCIKELNSPSFYSLMISLWITDSFERKEMERDLLAKLLITLCKHHSSLFSLSQLIQGFEHVLSSLEDAVNDAPKAPEFLGHIFAKMTLEDVLPLRDIGKIIYEGGEEPGSLLESGLASEVLGSVLDFIKTAKGDSMLGEIHKSSNLRLEDFMPRHPTKNNKLAAFL